MDKAKFVFGFITGAVIVVILRIDKWLPLLQELSQRLR